MFNFEKIASATFSNDAEWLDARKKYINSTESAALFNKGAWLTYYKLWHLKKGNLLDDFKESAKTRAGLIYERCIAEHFAEQERCEIKQVIEYRYSDDHKLGASYDYVALDYQPEGHERGLWNLEIKNLEHWTIKKWEDGEPSYQYLLQAQHQMLMNPELKGTVLCCLVNGWDLKKFIIPRNDRVCESIVTRTDKFWQSIEDNRSPEPDYEKDSGNVVKLFGVDNGEEEIASPYAMILAKEYHEISKTLKSLEARQNEIKAKLFEMSQAKKLVFDDGDLKGSISMSTTKANEGKLITPDMVGQRVGARAAFRQLRINLK